MSGDTEAAINYSKAMSLSPAVCALPLALGSMWLLVRQIRELIWLKSGWGRWGNIVFNCISCLVCLCHRGAGYEVAAGALHPVRMMVMLPSPTSESRNFSKPCLLHPESSQKLQGTHTHTKLTLQSTWLAASMEKLGIALLAVAEATVSSPLPWQPQSLRETFPGTSKRAALVHP